MFKKTAILICAYTLFSCGGGGGGGGTQTSSGNQQQTVQTAPTMTFSVDDTQPEQDENFELSWSASAGASCTASGSWNGNKARSGRETFSASDMGTFEFTLTCSNSAGETIRTVSVTVVEKTFSISGVISASSFVELDGDVPSADYPAIGNNGNDEGIQSIENPVKLVGFVSEPQDRGDADADSDADEFDIYEIGLTGNQWVSLEVADYNAEEPTSNDLDLYIVNEEVEIVSYGVSTDALESVALPNSGKFYIVVAAISGSSRYVLSVSNTISTYRFSNYSSNASVVPDSMMLSRVRKDAGETGIDSFRRLSEMDRSIMREFENVVGKGLQRNQDAEILRGPITVAERMTKDSDSEQKYLQKLNRILGDRWSRFLTEDVLAQILTKKYIARKSKALEGLKMKPQMKLRKYGFQKDPLFNYQWNFQQIGLQAALESIQVNQTDQIVAVLDEGSAPLSSSNYADTAYVDGGYDFVGGDDDPSASVTLSSDPYSTQSHESHGIHVSGVVGAKNDGENINGMGVNVLPVRVLSEEQNNSEVYEALRFFAGETNASGKIYDNSDGKLAALNLSLGACVEDTDLEDDEVCRLISKVRDQGVSVVVSAGNCDCAGGSGDLFCSVTNWPAACPGAISVAAVDAAAERAPYSSYHSTVDIAAPGGDVTADLNSDGQVDGVPSYVDLDELELWQGTSMAAPHVAGAIALMKHVDPNLSPADIDSLLQSGQLTNDNHQNSWNQELGYGVLEVSKSLESVAVGNDDTNLNAVPFFSPSEFDFGYTERSFSLSVKKRGSGDLEVVGLYADIAEHLSYSPEAISDANEIAKYSFTLKRDEIANGSIRNSIYFLMSDDNHYGIPLRYSIGEVRSPANVGTNILGVYDLKNEEVIEAILVDMTSGSANFSFDGLPKGDYILLALSDIDSSDEGENWLVGELLAIYPDSSSLDDGLRLQTNLTDIEISLTPYSERTFGASSTRGRSSRSVMKLLKSEKIARMLGR